MTALMFHFTNKIGFNAIHSQTNWLFKASKPPCENPTGAYFTTYPEGTPGLATKLRIPREKLSYVFSFGDVGDLLPIRGDRGRHIYYSPLDYKVVPERQIEAKATQYCREIGEI